MKHKRGHKNAGPPDSLGAAGAAGALPGTWDPVLRPEMAEPMRSLVTDLEVHQISACGHWTQQEKPAELNAILIDWLQRRFGAGA